MVRQRATNFGEQGESETIVSTYLNAAARCQHIHHRSPGYQAYDPGGHKYPVKIGVRHNVETSATVGD
jgi:hypothetical protein